MENSYQLNYYFDMNYYLFGKILSTELLFGLNYYTDLKSTYLPTQIAHIVDFLEQSECNKCCAYNQ